MTSRSKNVVVALSIAVLSFGLTNRVSARNAGDPCVSLGSRMTISGKPHECVVNARGKNVWRPRQPSPQTTAAQPVAAATVTPSVTLDDTFITGISASRSALVTSTVVGTVYFLEGSTPVTKVADITGAAPYRWTSGSVAVANTPTRIALDIDNLTNGFYRVFVATSSGELSSAATNTVTISVTRQPSTTVAALSCAAGGACAIGDIGPGGGVVFILATTAGNTTGKTFESARKDWDGGAQDGTAQWCAASDASIGGLGTAIGTGSSNSSTIATTCTSTGTNDAAEYVRGKTIGGKNDWFLPSRDEALEIYTQRSVFTGVYAINTTTVDTARYLTSSQGTTSTANAVGAYLQGSSFPGSAQEVSKSFGFSVRPVRSFVAS